MINKDDFTLNDRLLPALKALADINRLRIVGLLAQSPHTGEQIVALLGLRPSTISHHLSRLRQAGLVSASAESYYSVYRLEMDTIRALAQALLSSQTLAKMANDADLNAYDRMVLAGLTRAGGKLKIPPSPSKALSATLRSVAGAFKPGICYTKRQVDRILVRYHNDVAALRGELVAAHLLEQRSGGVFVVTRSVR